MSVQLEVCVDSFASALAAKAGGADRLELCSALASGGTTPSYGFVAQCVEELQLPVMMMVRPHDGGFVYDSDAINTMLRDIQVAKSLGVRGIVFGALTADRGLDHSNCRRLIDAAESLETTFHRAFDLVSNPLEVLEEIEKLGIDRVLTSGQESSAQAGIKLIRKMSQQVNSLIVLAGAGLTAENAQEVVQQTGVREIHASASVAAQGQQEQGSLSFGFGRKVTCSEKVRAIKEAVKQL